jgi:hypothetical protein
MFMAQARRKVCFANVNVIGAAEFPVDGAGSVLACNEGVVAYSVGAAYVACFSEYHFDVSMGLQDSFSDYVLVWFEGWAECRL